MGFPQFNPEYFASQVFWLLLCLSFLFTFLKRVFIPRLEGILERRNKHVYGDLERAKSLRTSIQKNQADYSEKIAQNQRKARHQREERLAELEDFKKKRVERLQKIFVRKRALLEKSALLDIQVEQNFLDLLIAEASSERRENL
ncbi:hypothetical protein AGMMS49949_07580 [Alphaproteobacteria bacterium]|nr:hypothetical protein AGMMS49949_07580 [Alphaproteobacteria bacterium]GHT00635.1 hypothetical protein AGMMS50296_8970 [Alphaproteobacteria bacterium]